jgi:outer membrane lipoprotein-sorting protein
VNILRRLPLSRLLLLCVLVVVLGVSLTALAFALGSAPTPPPKPLAQAVHDALTAPPVEGVSATVKLTDHLLEGANLASGDGEANQLSASPLLSGATGRLWIAKDGRARLELQAEGGDTQVIYDGHDVSVYDTSSNTLYKIATPAVHHESVTRTSKATPEEIETMRRRIDKIGVAQPEIQRPDTISVAQPEVQDDRAGDEIPSVAKIEEAISKLEHVNVSGATPANIAGQPAYTERITPKEGGSLIGGVELSWDAVHGTPLRFALYSSTSSSPVIELAATEISYGAVPDSVFDVNVPANAKVEELKLPDPHAVKGKTHREEADGNEHPNVTVHGKGITGVAVLESKVKPGEKGQQLPEQLPKVKIGDTTAAELQTPLGTLLSFERDGVRYLLAGALDPSAIEAVARGL